MNVYSKLSIFTKPTPNPSTKIAVKLIFSRKRISVTITGKVLVMTVVCSSHSRHTRFNMHLA